MLYTVAIVFIVIFALEAAVVIIVFTIFVFKTQSGLHLKRTCLLLINLAVADLLVGVGEVVVLVIHRIPKTDIRSLTVWWIVQAFGFYVSVMFLAILSLKRVYAVFWPLRHRLTSARAYIFSIVIVCVIGLCITGLSLLTVYHADVDTVYAVATADFLLFISLVIICLRYLSIRSRLYATKPDLQDGQRRSTRDQNIRLSKTFYIVVAVSLIFWLPSFVVYTINAFRWQCFSSTLLWFGLGLQLANSMVNPFVYRFRMKIFKDSLKKCLKKRVDLKRVTFRVQNAPQEFTTHL
ncbi:adenosine receptor A2a-like [Orbicella faveolata]|uniref:adenosine receptor A2a-like n=1 Tax=Orbicella faveolata TaxID=48498 RepID=UPI0009E1C8C8|nr:adenosine receptor A2a-like [Orbicella faveolata]